jgi:hypothetical protein
MAMTLTTRLASGRSRVTSSHAHVMTVRGRVLGKRGVRRASMKSIPDMVSW